jgi:hypothetical protein
MGVFQPEGRERPDIAEIAAFMIDPFATMKRD